jgi:hypothetical protein
VQPASANGEECGIQSEARKCNTKCVKEKEPSTEQIKKLDMIVSRANDALSSALFQKEEVARRAQQAIRLLNLEKMRVAAARGRANAATKTAARYSANDTAMDQPAQSKQRQQLATSATAFAIEAEDHMAVAKRKAGRLITEVKEAQATVFQASKGAQAASEAVKSAWINITGSFPQPDVNLSSLEAENSSEDHLIGITPPSAVMSTEVPAVTVAAVGVEAAEEEKSSEIPGVAVAVDAQTAEANNTEASSSSGAPAMKV